MVKDIMSLIDASIILEFTVGDLYNYFSTLDTRDTYFWNQLALEELNHAALLKSSRLIYTRTNLFPDGLLLSSKALIEEATKEILSLKAKFEKNTPTRAKRFSTAYYVEMSAAQLHFQFFMESEPLDIIGKITKKLNGKDKDHAKRIKEYIVRNEIAL